MTIPKPKKILKKKMMIQMLLYSHLMKTRLTIIVEVPNRETLNTPIKQKLSDFFNNIPSPESPVRFNSAKELPETIPATPEEHEFIPESPENLSLNQAPNAEPEIARNTDSSVTKINSSDLNATNDASHLSINISTKIQINIQISELDKPRCESAEPEAKPDETKQKSSPDQEKPSSFEESAETSGSLQNSTSPPKNTDKFVGLNQSDVEIDEEMEGILNELYGKTWQTPQLLEKCLSTKKRTCHQPQIQENVRDQSGYIDFSLFGNKINNVLESTRLPEKMNEPKTVDKPKGSTARKKPAKKLPPKQMQSSSSNEDEPHQTARRLDFEHVGRPKRQAALKNKLVQICDPDSSSDSDSESSCENGSDSDLNFTINVNDIPNESSDDEDLKENRRNRGIGKILDRYEYKKKPAIPATPPLPYVLPASQKTSGNSKRKLFTPQHFDVSLPDEVSTSSKPNRSAEDDSLKQISEWITLKNKKLEEIKNRDLFLTPKPDPIGKAKPETIKKSSAKPPSRGDQKYGFLQSLDEKLPKEYCHPEAIQFRDNYAKTKYKLSEKLYALYNERIFKFENDIDVSWNKKLLTTAGRCMTKRKFGERSCRIELSEKVLTTADRLRCTLVHELCHAATWMYDGENGHGPKWKLWASKSMKIFPELPKIGVCHSYDIEYKYTYMCVQCNAKQQAHSKSIKVETKCCKYCRGKIEVFLNKKTKDGGILHTPLRSAKGFAKFVQDNYKVYKTDNLKHVDVMKILSNKFKELGVSAT